MNECKILNASYILAIMSCTMLSKLACPTVNNLNLFHNIQLGRFELKGFHINPIHPNGTHKI